MSKCFPFISKVDGFKMHLLNAPESIPSFSEDKKKKKTDCPVASNSVAHTDAVLHSCPRESSPRKLALSLVLLLGEPGP